MSTVLIDRDSASSGHVKQGSKYVFICGTANKQYNVYLTTKNTNSIKSKIATVQQFEITRLKALI